MSEKQQQRPKFDKTPVQPLTTGEKIARFVKDVLTLIITGGIIFFFNVYDVMLNSKRIYRELMYIALACHTVALFIGTYMTWVTSRTDPDFDSDQSWKKIQITTGFLVTGTVLWMISVWPVFHFWTLLLGVCFLFFTVTFVSMISVERPKPKLH